MDDIRDQVEYLASCGMSVEEIAQTLGVPEDAVREALKLI